MNFLTHIMISKTLYRHLSKEMDLDRSAFLYGNIKPDLSPKCLRNPHILENYLFIVCNQSNQLINHHAPLKEYSVDLGEICHYICDFFCYYHLDYKIYHKLFYHFLYEIRLHLALCSLLLKQKINLTPGRENPDKNIASMVMEMRKEYMTEHKTLQRDIEYAFTTALWACEAISRLSSDTAESAAEINLNYSKAFYSPYRV
ncbi:MAG TPA: zinc dependent phospholipase C family protein [Anaerovoracaceae bacterium]|nr:zinc dependent phospholipase C family protein [Anaerovoracaceae bacterium]